MLKLSREIPAHTEMIELKWVHRNFSRMNPIFRKMRSRQGHPYGVCAWCGHEFADDEKLNLAQIDNGPQRVLCQTCIEQAEEES